MKEIRIESSSYLGVNPGDRIAVGKTEYEIVSTTHDHGSSGHVERVVAIERGEAMAERLVFQTDGMTLTGAVLMALREATSEKESVCESDVARHIASRISERLSHHVACAKDKEIVSMRMEINRLNEKLHSSPDYAAEMLSKNMLEAKEDVRKTIESQIRYQHDWFGPRRSSIKDDQVDAARYVIQAINSAAAMTAGEVLSRVPSLSRVTVAFPDAKPKSGYLIMTPDGMVPEVETSDYAVMCPSCGRIIPEHVGGCRTCVKTCDRCDHQCKPDGDGVCCDIGGCFGRSEWTPKRRSE